MSIRFTKLLGLLLLLFAGASGCGPSEQVDRQLLNVSYDPTRELYEQLNPLFVAQWKKDTGETLKINQSHAGSGKQAHAVIDGLPADVVTLALAYDIDVISQKGKELLPADWQKKLTDNSAPYTSTIVFVVKKGNPKQIEDWDSLKKEGVSVVTPNPKTSGGARWNYLAAWGYALEKYNNSDAEAQQFLKDIFANVKSLETGARGAANAFTKGTGDVFISWENEAFQILKDHPEEYEIITPSISILAEPPVAVVEKNAEKAGNMKAAKAYLEFLYTPEAQEVIAKNHYRPRSKEVAAKYPFSKVKLFTIDEKFGSWREAQKKHFDDQGTFDQIYVPAAN